MPWGIPRIWIWKQSAMNANPYFRRQQRLIFKEIDVGGRKKEEQEDNKRLLWQWHLLCSAVAATSCRRFWMGELCGGGAGIPAKVACLMKQEGAKSPKNRHKTKNLKVSHLVPYQVLDKTGYCTFQCFQFLLHIFWSHGSTFHSLERPCSEQCEITTATTQQQSVAAAAPHMETCWNYRVTIALRGRVSTRLFGCCG